MIAHPGAGQPCPTDLKTPVTLAIGPEGGFTTYEVDKIVITSYSIHYTKLYEFLTPPFGFSLFYLKGVAPPEVKTTDIYYGVIPFITLQAIVLAILVIFPEFFGFSPHS